MFTTSSNSVTLLCLLHLMLAELLIWCWPRKNNGEKVLVDPTYALWWSSATEGLFVGMGIYHRTRWMTRQVRIEELVGIYSKSSPDIHSPPFIATIPRLGFSLANLPHSCLFQIIMYINRLIVLTFSSVALVRGHSYKAAAQYQSSNSYVNTSFN